MYLEIIDAIIRVRINDRIINETSLIKKKILLILERKKERKKTSFQRVGSRISDNWLARENFSFFRPYSWILVSTRNDERKLELHVGVCLVSLGNRSS